MGDILVERCALRIVRRGGWGWGSDPRRVLRTALEQLPLLVGTRLAKLLEDLPGERTIVEPLRLRVPMRLEELRSGALAGGASHAGGASPWISRLDGALKEAVASIGIPQSSAATSERAPEAPREADRAAPGAVLAEILTEWWSSGILHAVLAALPDEALKTWVVALRNGPPMGTPALGHVVRQALARSADDGGLRADSGPARPATATLLIDLAVGLSPAAHGRGTEGRGFPGISSRADSPPAAALVRSRGSLLGDQATPPGTRVAGPAEATPKMGPHALDPPKGSGRTLLTDLEVHVPSALPWLLLVPLHKLGYLRVLGAVLDLAGLGTRAQLFGAALAYKLAPTGERPWEKSAASERLASAAAAGREPVSKPSLYGFARQITAYCPLLDGHVTHSIVSGMRDDGVWLVNRLSRGDAGGFVLMDADGLFPARWGASPEELPEIVRAAPGADVVVPEGAADPQLLRRLDGSGVRFVTTARPGRNERWVRLPPAGSRAWWSNRAGPAARPTRRWMSRIDQVASRAKALGDELSERRRALVLEPTSALERSLTLAASLALGTIAWMLWHEREATDPCLALSRFEDLDARVRFTARSVRVILPLGARRHHLHQAGLLADVHGIPWLGGRLLEFSGS